MPAVASHQRVISHKPIIAPHFAEVVQISTENTASLDCLHCSWVRNRTGRWKCTFYTNIFKTGVAQFLLLSRKNTILSVLKLSYIFTLMANLDIMSAVSFPSHPLYRSLHGRNYCYSIYIPSGCYYTVAAAT